MKLEDVQMQYRQLENKNNELLKKDKNVVSLQENFENELTKHNQALLLNEQKLKEQIAMNKQEIDNLKEERKSLNNLMNEAVVKCSILIKEKNDLEKNIENYTLSFEVSFPYDDDVCYFANSIPYTLTDLTEFIFKI